MATKTIVSVLDDIDGSENAETVTFSYGGSAYEIDLSDKNKKALEKALAPYIEKGRTISSRRPSGAPRGASTSKDELDKLRAWARENGFEVSDRGRVSAQIREAYAAAN